MTTAESLATACRQALRPSWTIRRGTLTTVNAIRSASEAAMPYSWVRRPSPESAGTARRSEGSRPSPWPPRGGIARPCRMREQLHSVIAGQPHTTSLRPARPFVRPARVLAGVAFLLAALAAPAAVAFSVLAHQAVVDRSWESVIVQALKRRFPNA